MLPGVLSAVLALPGFALVQAQTKIVLSNDDGWATGNIRAFYAALRAEDYNVCLFLSEVVCELILFLLVG